LPAQADDQLEWDEVWSFVLKRKNKRWLRTAMCADVRAKLSPLRWATAA
jgi:hypothetical protein